MILGLDEVGRGPLAGPLVVGATIIGDLSDPFWRQVRDSKRLTRAARAKLAPEIQQKCVAFGLGWISATEFDTLGVMPALSVASARAILDLLRNFGAIATAKDQKIFSKNLKISLKNDSSKASFTEFYRNLPPKLPFSEVIIDGNRNFLPNAPFSVSTLIKGDDKIKAISAASIIAKVAHDEYMLKIAKKYSEYDFENCMGYGTKKHLAALKKFGPTPEHRRSVKPCKTWFPTNQSAETAVKGAETTTHSAQNTDFAAQNTTTSTSVGHCAEQAVAEYLKKQGHKIVSRNFKTRLCEIDLVTVKNRKLYFTEVKYSKNIRHGAPLERVNAKKLRQMRRGAEVFLSYVAAKTARAVEQLPQPILAAASVVGNDFQVVEWSELDFSDLERQNSRER